MFITCLFYKLFVTSKFWLADEMLSRILTADTILDLLWWRYSNLITELQYIQGIGPVPMKIMFHLYLFQKLPCYLTPRNEDKNQVLLFFFHWNCNSLSYVSLFGQKLSFLSTCQLTFYFHKHCLQFHTMLSPNLQMVQSWEIRDGFQQILYRKFLLRTKL